MPLFNQSEFTFQQDVNHPSGQNPNIVVIPPKPSDTFPSIPSQTDKQFSTSKF